MFAFLMDKTMVLVYLRKLSKLYMDSENQLSGLSFQNGRVKIFAITTVKWEH